MCANGDGHRAGSSLRWLAGLAGVLAVAQCVAAVAAPPGQQPAEQQAAGPALRVVVDPRVELLSIIFRLAGNPEYCQGRVPGYVKDVAEHFGPVRDHAVVKLAQRLRRTRGVSYDACMSMAVHVGDAYELRELVPLESAATGAAPAATRASSLDSRWRPDEARQFLSLARQFVKDSHFRQFIEQHEPLYRLAVNRMEAVVRQEKLLEWFDRFFGQRPQATFTVALGLLNGGACYGPSLRTSDGKERLYCILGVWRTDAKGMPQFDRTMLRTVVHEFCHSYTNPLVDKHEAELQKAGQLIYPYVATAMRRQAYGHWQTMMRESLVRACVARYISDHDGPLAAQVHVRQQAQRQFTWIGELSELLGQYERQRDRYPTLESFFPRIIAFFDDYAPRFARQQKELDTRRPKIVSISPANGSKNVDPAVSVIKIVFDRPMQDRSWSVVGGGPHFPQITGRPAYDATGKVWTVPVKLKPNWSYTFMLNSARFTGFRSRDGVPLAPVTVSFRTGKAGL